jgi:DNA-binding response OmpR family regulator
VLFVTSEPASALVQQADSLGISLIAPGWKEQFVLLQLSGSIAGLVRQFGGVELVEAARQEATGADLVIFETLTEVTAELLDMQPLRSAVEAILTWEPARKPRVVATANLETLNASKLLSRSVADFCGALVELDREEDGQRFIRVVKSRYSVAEVGRLAFQMGAGGTQLLNPEAPSPATTATARPPAESELPPGSRRRVLLIDEDVAACEQLKHWLEPDLEVTSVDNGLGALSEVMANPPNLIVLELTLSGISGYDILSTLRRAGTQIPILVLSWRLSRAIDRIRPLVLGASDLMEKPPHEIEFRHRVETLLSSAPKASKLTQNADLALLHEGGSRVLDEPAFREHTERAFQLGEELQLESTLVSLEFESPDEIEALTSRADSSLRTEDAIHVCDDTRALMLLVASSATNARKALCRLLGGIPELGDVAVKVGFVPLSRESLDPDWGKLFDALEPLQESEA